MNGVSLTSWGLPEYLALKRCRLRTCKIGHDSRGRSAGWHLSYLRLKDLETQQVWYFPCDQWLDKNVGDGSTSVTLTATTKDPKEHIRSYKVNTIFAINKSNQ